MSTVTGLSTESLQAYTYERVHSTSRKEQINQFISSLREHDKPLTAFDVDLWNAIVDHGTVHPNKIVFTLKDGTEAECEI